MERIPVFACARSDHEPDMAPDGYAASEAEAARIMRKVIAETDGDPDTGIKASNIYYSPHLRAYFVEE